MAIDYCLELVVFGLLLELLRLLPLVLFISFILGNAILTLLKALYWFCWFIPLLWLFRRFWNVWLLLNRVGSNCCHCDRFKLFIRLLLLQLLVVFIELGDFVGRCLVQLLVTFSLRNLLLYIFSDLATCFSLQLLRLESFSYFVIRR